MQAGHEVSLYESTPELGGLVRTFDVGGSRLEAYYHHIFSTDTTMIDLINELGVGDRLKWVESKVGWFKDGKIYPFVTPIDLLKFAPLPLIDRVKLGLMGVRLRGREDWAEFEHITCKTGSRRTSRRTCSTRCGGPAPGSTATPRPVAMAWLWSKIHLRFQSRKSGPLQKEELDT
jgi:protoporphyrinogen oxidase